jgi:hypothetical protein
MAVSTKDIRRSLTDPTPVYAWLGAGDATVAALRELPARAVELRDRAADLPQYLGELRDAARREYDGMADRGRRLVVRVRRQRATAALREQAGNTVRATRAARTTATRSASSTRRATKGAATSARKTARTAATAAGATAGKVGR